MSVLTDQVVFLWKDGYKAEAISKRTGMCVLNVKRLIKLAKVAHGQEDDGRNKEERSIAVSMILDGATDWQIRRKTGYSPVSIANMRYLLGPNGGETLSRVRERNQEMARRWERGATVEELGRQYNVTPRHVGIVLRSMGYRYVPDRLNDEKLTIEKPTVATWPCMRAQEAFPVCRHHKHCYLAPFCRVEKK